MLHPIGHLQSLLHRRHGLSYLWIVFFQDIFVLSSIWIKYYLFESFWWFGVDDLIKGSYLAIKFLSHLPNSWQVQVPQVRAWPKVQKHVLQLSSSGSNHIILDRHWQQANTPWGPGSHTKRISQTYCISQQSVDLQLMWHSLWHHSVTWYASIKPMSLFTKRCYDICMLILQITKETPPTE